MAQPRRGSSASTLGAIRIILIEPRALVGLGIRGVIDGEPDMEVVAEVRSAEEAIAVAEDRAPDVFVLDVELQEPITSAATHRLAQESPGSGMVVVGGEDDDTSILDAIEIGAMGHVAAVAQPAELVAVIRRVADGEDPLKDEVIDRPDLVDKIIDGLRESYRHADDVRPHPLTPRELEVLQLVAEGRKNREIADLLDLSEKTVKNHLTSILHKLGVPNRTRAVTLGVREGWLALSEGGSGAGAHRVDDSASARTTASTVEV